MLLLFEASNEKTIVHRTSPHVQPASVNSMTASEDAERTCRMESYFSVGYENEPELSILCDQKGFIWVHERCAAWTLASIAANSAQDLRMDVSNKLLSKVSFCPNNGRLVFR